MEQFKNPSEMISETESILNFLDMVADKKKCPQHIKSKIEKLRSELEKAKEK